MGLAATQPPAAHHVDTCRFKPFAADSRNHVPRHLSQEAIIPGHGSSIPEVLSHGVERLPYLDHRPQVACDLPAGVGYLQAPERFGQAVVVGEHDQLAFLGDLGEDAGQPVHPGGVHRLYRVVDHQESERVCRQCGAWEEEGESQAADLTLAGDGQGLCFLSVNYHPEVDVASGTGSGEFHRLQIYVAVETEIPPQTERLGLYG